MPVITQIHTAMNAKATGMLAPIIRAATHVGYAIGVADKVDQPGWILAHEDVTNDLGHALEHMKDSIGTDHSDFVSDTAIAAFDTLRKDVEKLVGALPSTREESIAELQRLVHNIAYTAALYEKDLSGFAADEGRDT